MRLFALIVAALGALVTLALALHQPAASPDPAPCADQLDCEAELRECRAQGHRVAERVLRCLSGKR